MYYIHIPFISLKIASIKRPKCYKNCRVRSLNCRVRSQNCRVRSQNCRVRSQKLNSLSRFYFQIIFVQ